MTVPGAMHRRMLLAFGALTLASLATPPAATAGDVGRRPAGLFGYLEFASHELAALPQWREALARIADERQQIVRCEADVSRCGSVAETVWRAKVDELKLFPPHQRLLEANRYVNSIPGQRQTGSFDPLDHWKSPLEVLDEGGDPKDLAVMKFVTLRDAGIANDAMRIVIVYDALRNQRHAVLAVMLDDGTYVLDTVSDVVRRAEQVRYYVPYYSVNETTRWAHVVRQPHRSDG